LSDAAEARCGACGAVLGERQRWCLACGAATRTALATAPRWLATATVAALIAVLALVGIGYAAATLLSS
jgi:hypothetical protein